MVLHRRPHQLSVVGLNLLVVGSNHDVALQNHHIVDQREVIVILQSAWQGLSLTHHHHCIPQKRRAVRCPASLSDGARYPQKNSPRSRALVPEESQSCSDAMRPIRKWTPCCVVLPQQKKQNSPSRMPLHCTRKERQRQNTCPMKKDQKFSSV